ncbi:MAG: PEGA domain-containing protein [Acidobacteria bacterium]|nr:PEGA domain-containing protein [Acidobacteriota bacterium]
MNSLKTSRFPAAPPHETTAEGVSEDKGIAALDAFGTELSPATRRNLSAIHREPPAARPPHIGSAAKWIGIMVLAAGAAAGGVWAYAKRPAAVVPASLTLNTVPSGLEIAVAGKLAGVTPLTLSLSPGNHRVRISGAGAQPREIAVTLKAGETVVQHLEMAPTATVLTATTGAMTVQTEPSRRAVMVDGIDRGFSPLTVPALAAGDHLVVVRGASGVMRRTVTVKAGETVSLVIAAGESPAVSAGWLTVVSPVVLQLKVGGRLIGTSDTDRVLIAAGDHQIEMSNDELGFRTKQRVTVGPGKTAEARVRLPQGTLSINAVPWAEVWVGGERVGETPIANLSRRIGVHDVILRHPEFGERTASLTVSLKQTARLGVDMRKP